MTSIRVHSLAGRCRTNGHPNVAGPFHHLFHSSNDFRRPSMSCFQPCHSPSPSAARMILQTLNKAVNGNGFHWCRRELKILLDLTLPCLPNSIRHTGHRWILRYPSSLPSQGLCPYCPLRLECYSLRPLLGWL